MSCLSVIFFLWELEASTIPITVNYCLIHTFASLPRTSILPTLVQVRMNLTFNNMYGPLRTHMVNSCHKRPSTLVDQSNKWVGAENINPSFSTTSPPCVDDAITIEVYRRSLELGHVESGRGSL